MENAMSILSQVSSLTPPTESPRHSHVLSWPVSDESMLPALRPNQWVRVNAHKPCKSGDLALIQLRDKGDPDSGGPIYLREVHFSGNGTVELKAYNGEDIIVSHDEISSLWGIEDIIGTTQGNGGEK